MKWVWKMNHPDGGRVTLDFETEDPEVTEADAAAFMLKRTMLDLGAARQRAKKARAETRKFGLLVALYALLGVWNVGTPWLMWLGWAGAAIMLLIAVIEAKMADELDEQADGIRQVFECAVKLARRLADEKGSK